MRRVSSRQNAIVGRFRELARGAGENGEILLDGEHLIEEALAERAPLEVVAVSERLAARNPNLIDRAIDAGADVVCVPDALMSAISPVKQASGIVAISRAEPESLQGVLATAPQLVPVLAGVQDAGNVGAIVRTADGCGATGLIACEGTADPFGWKALRGAMGSTLRLPIAVKQPIEITLDELRRKRITIAAAVPRDGTPLPACDLCGPIAILLGGEGAGLSAETIAAASMRITIPMRPRVESFNVSITAALILYEAARQRATPDVPVRRT